MLKQYPNEIFCDLAETYHLFDYKALSPSKVAVLVSGLRAESRVFIKMQKINHISHDLMFAMLFDCLSGNKEAVMLNFVMGKNKNEDAEHVKTMDHDDFMRMRYGKER